MTVRRPGTGWRRATRKQHFLTYSSSSLSAKPGTARLRSAFTCGPPIGRRRGAQRRVEHHAGRRPARDRPHGERGVVGEDGSDSHEHGVAGGAQSAPGRKECGRIGPRPVPRHRSGYGRRASGVPEDHPRARFRRSCAAWPCAVCRLSRDPVSRLPGCRAIDALRQGRQQPIHDPGGAVPPVAARGGERALR